MQRSLKKLINDVVKAGYVASQEQAKTLVEELVRAEAHDVLAKLQAKVKKQKELLSRT